MQYPGCRQTATKRDVVAGCYIIFCVVPGCYILFFAGKPQPNVVWLLDEELEGETRNVVASGAVRNHLLLGPLNHNHSGVRLTCVVTSHHLVAKQEVDFYLEVQCGYLELFLEFTILL